MTGGPSGRVELVVDPRDGTITGPGGSVRLEPKVMAVLGVLANRAGQVVSREELLDEVWADVVVTEHTLSRCIYQLRNRLKEVGERAEPGEFVSIETLTKRGYRLVVPPGVEVTLSAVKPGSVVRTVGAVQALQQPSIAVLPFTDMSPAQDHAYFADGIAEELINGLSRIKELRVSARTSSFRFRGAQDLSSIGRELAVRTVLEGSVRRSGNRIRISAQLIDVESDGYLWSERYDRELGDVFDVQDDVAVRVINALQVELAPGSHKVIDVGTDNIDAYNAYLLGTHEARRQTRRSLSAAIDYYRRALAYDGNFTAAWGGLGSCHLLLMLSLPGDVTEMRDGAREAFAQARSRGWEHPTVPWIFVERLFATQSAPDQRALAREDIEKVRNPDPEWRHFEYLHLSTLLARVDLAEAAIDFYRLHRDRFEYPASELYIWGLPTDVITLLAACERYEEAITEATRRIEEDSEVHIIRAERCIINARIGDLGAAAPDIAIIRQVWHRSFAEVCYLYWAGHKSEARELFTLMNAGGTLHPLPGMCGALLFEEVDQFLGCLEELVGRKDPTALYVRVQLRRYASAELRREVERHPRYRAALEQLGIDDTWRRELAEMVNGVSAITGIRVASA